VPTALETSIAAFEQENAAIAKEQAPTRAKIEELQAALSEGDATIALNNERIAALTAVPAPRQAAKPKAAKARATPRKPAKRKRTSARKAASGPQQAQVSPEAIITFLGSVTGESSRHEIAEALSVEAKGSLQRVLAKLVKAGAINKTGTTADAAYSVKK
jgi:hypothetical protein